MKIYIRAAVLDVNSEDLAVKKELAESSDTSMFVLKQLAMDTNRFVRKIVAENPITSAEILKILATDIYSGVREGVARNPNATAEVLSLLALDNEEIIRNAVTLSPNVTDKILMTMVKNDNKDFDNAFMVSRCDKASADTLKYIFEHVDHEDSSVMRRLANNPNTSIDVIKKLAAIQNTYISLPAKNRLEKMQ